jgi:hypothetical protein
MVVPSSCGKLQLLRGVGANAPVARGAAARRVAQPAALVIMFSSCAAALAVTAQGGARAPRHLIVSSMLERIGPTAEGDAEDSVQITTDTLAPPAVELIVNVRFTNWSEHVLDSIRITSPIPADLRYLADSASGPGADVLFSVDSGRSFGRPEELTVQAPDGSVRGADPADYTHVRWVLRASLDAGASGVARFRAVPR